MKLAYFIVLLTTFSHSFAQVDSNNYTPPNGFDAAKLLSEGTLIVRLSRYEADLVRMEAYSGPRAANTEKNKIKEAQKKLIEEFKKDFSFSDVVFAYDVELYNFLQDSTLRIFIDDELKVDSSTTLKEGPIFILATNGYKYHELYDTSYNLIKNPSPIFINRHYARKYRSFLASLFYWISNQLTRKVSVAKFNRNLEKWSRKS